MYLCNSNADVSNVPPQCREHGRGMGGILQYKEAGQQEGDNRHVGSPGSRSTVTTFTLSCNLHIEVKTVLILQREVDIMLKLFC